MAQTGINDWHADLVALNGWKQERRAEIEWNFRGPAQAEALAELELSYQLQVMGMRHYYQVFEDGPEPASEEAMQMSDQDYKEFEAMKRQAGVVDKILLFFVALGVVLLVCVILGALAAAKA